MKVKNKKQISKKQDKPESHFEYNHDNLKLIQGIIQDELSNKLYKNREQALNAAGKKLQKMVESGEINQNDILAMQDAGKMNFGDFLIFSGQFSINATTGISRNDAIDLGRRYHFMLLEISEISQKETTIETFTKYEQIIEEIYHGTISKEKMKIIESLPTFDEWHEIPEIRKIATEAYKRYHNVTDEELYKEY